VDDAAVIYIASPYSHDTKAIRDWRAQAVARYAADLVSRGLHVFCPISHSHPWTEFGVCQDHEFWMEFDRPFMDMCDQLHVYTLPGWGTSRGVAEEIRHFVEKEKPVHYIVPLQKM
tara:strand:- start:152 stop:499 length:348 start_codon:yes stop_codon:yes gene_type:complete